jgi:hypothetical protein
MGAAGRLCEAACLSNPRSHPISSKIVTVQIPPPLVSESVSESEFRIGARTRTRTRTRGGYLNCYF